MASGLVNSNKMKRMESKKSHSWLWDSHISPKNNKWLQENLEEMDGLVKRMFKLIEEDADSFARKAELYIKKRPELANLVEEFYRMYRALAERYDLVSGELRKAIPSDIRSQGSGISDVASEPSLSMPSPDRRPSRSESGPRAAGFDVFLGSGSDVNSKEGDNASTVDSESESGSDDSSVNSSTESNHEENGLQRRIVELEAELEKVNEKLGMQPDEICENCKKICNQSSEVYAKVASYEEELRVAQEKIQASEEMIAGMSIELQKYKSSEGFDSVEPNQVCEVQESINGSAGEVLDDSVQKMQAIADELRVTKEKLHESEEEVASLRQELTRMDLSVISLENQLESAQKEVFVWKSKLDSDNGEVSKLQDRIARYKTNLADRDQEIRALREAMSNANKSLSEENEQLGAEVTRMTKERAHLEHNLKELDVRFQSVEEEVRRVGAAKAEIEATFGDQIEQLKTEINERDDHIEELKKRLDEGRLMHGALMVAKDDLDGKIGILGAEISNRDKQITQMTGHLHQLHMQLVQLISGAEAAQKTAEDLRLRVKELEIEVQRKQETINEGAEGKREAIRQLCFSLEHYRSGYHQLRQAVNAHKQPVILAT